MELFEVKVKYTKQSEDGSLKRVTEPFIVDAPSFGDAEEKMFKYMEQMGHSGEILVTAIKRENITDLLGSENHDVWYRAIIAFESQDADSGKSKEIKQHIMIQEDSVKGATSGVLNYFISSPVKIEVKSVKETNVQDIVMDVVLEEVEA